MAFFLPVLVLVSVLLTGAKQSSELNSFEPVEGNVKIFGRTVYDDGSLWLGLSATGVGFTFTGSKAEFVMHGDDVPSGREYGQRLVVFADGLRYADVLLNDDKEEVIKVELKRGVHRLRLIKASECSRGTAKLDEIRLDSEKIKAETKKKRKIEFIGDSITCGYAIDSKKKSDGFQLSQEDATKTYAYKTAKYFNADTSFVCYSGCGIYAGYSGIPDEPDKNNLMPDFYELAGHSYFSMDRKFIDNFDWDFKECPDLIVINLGTNDMYYVRDVKSRQKGFQKEYIAFMKRVRKLNPDAHILSAVGFYDNGAEELVEEAVEDYSKAAKDNNVSFLALDYIDKAVDGVGGDGHPKEVSHDKAVKQLTEKISQVMDW